MTQFATSDDLAARLGETLTDDEQTRADVLLAQVAALIQDESKQKLIRITDDVLTMPGRNVDRIALPERPVISVASVTLNGNAIAFILSGDTIFRRPLTVWDADFDYDGRWSRGFGRMHQTLAITYTHGYADEDIPGLCKSISLEAVVRCWVNPGAVARETVGNTSTVYDNNRFAPTGLLLNDDERKQITRFFGNRSQSISVG